MPRLRTTALAAVVLGAAGGVLIARSEDGAGTGTHPPAASGPRLQTTAPRASEPPFEPARCPPQAANCAAVTGRVIAVESVDPDGDGDLHVVAAGGSVTAPGITVFDVKPALRPAEDPSIGDRVTGAGPVFRGSFGQRQIEVTEFRVR